MNDSNCEIYTIHNVLVLTRRQESSLEWIESKLLRLEYVDALIAACF
jgi:ribosomal protein L44E